jgi:EAL domain-containing protein (putative c-di-GMP-specific phosphodiesterase class I)
MEALVRWNHPERGLVAPLEFIPLAEQTGLIVSIGEMVFDKACAQLATWQSQGLPVVPVSINVSPKQFNHGDLKLIIAACMSRHGIQSSLVEIEITESCMMGDSGKIAEQLADIKMLGIRIAIDDFGTGYSSLSQLQKLDVDVLKVDRAFTEALGTGIQGEAFFMTIVSMAHILGMRVVAEGVETLEQLRILKALSCNEVQGYLVSKPVPAGEVEALLKKRFLFHHSAALLQTV